MITITQITSDNETKLMGEIDNFSYCITYNKDIHDKLEELSKQIDLCDSFDEWTAIIESAKILVEDNPYSIQGSKYFAKINEEFFLTYGKKYYNIKDSRNIIKNVLNYYIDKGLNIDKFAIFLARKGNANILKLGNVYHRINRNGNIRMNLVGEFKTSYTRYILGENNNIRTINLDFPRYFVNGSLVESNTSHSLKSLGVKFSNVLAHDSEDGIPVLIKPDLECFIGDLEQGGLIVDPDDEVNWSDYITSFIDTYGKEH